MSFEIEKKYRLTEEQREQVLRKLKEVGAEFEGQDFEENTLYGGGILNLKACILRLRRTENKAILTYKEDLPSESSIKRRIERETEISKPEAIHQIFESLGYKPALVYEKRRQTWKLDNVELVLDELPFGWFMEIEGEEDEIIEAEKLLGIEDFTPEMQTYPNLTEQFGNRNDDLIEARFK